MPDAISPTWGYMFEPAVEAPDCVRDTFTTNCKFIKDTLEVIRDGMTLPPESYEELPDCQSFRILLDPANKKSPKHLPRDSEYLLVRYIAA